MTKSAALSPPRLTLHDAPGSSKSLTSRARTPFAASADRMAGAHAASAAPYDTNAVASFAIAGRSLDPGRSSQCLRCSSVRSTLNTRALISNSREHLEPTYPGSSDLPARRRRRSCRTARLTLHGHLPSGRRSANGVRALDVNDLLDPGAIVARGSISEAIEAADFVIGVFSDERSPAVLREMQALTSNIRVVPIVIGADVEVRSPWPQIQALSLSKRMSPRRSDPSSTPRWKAACEPVAELDRG